MKNYAVVTLDATGSMTGQEERVVSSMNEYVEELKAELKEDFHISVFMFDSSRWITFYEGNAPSWRKMQLEDYRTGAMTPLYDAIAKTIAHADTLASDGDRVMVMIDTDGYENSSREHTQASIKALVDQKKAAGWAFQFMASGIDIKQADSVGDTGDRIGMPVQRASHRSRGRSYDRSREQTREYFESGAMPVSARLEDDDDALAPKVRSAGRGVSNGRRSAGRGAKGDGRRAGRGNVKKEDFFER